MSATLRQLIEQATPGPWHSSSNTLHDASGIAIAECLSRGSETPSPESNAQLIARCNPATMLAVIEALESVSQHIGGIQGHGINPFVIADTPRNAALANVLIALRLLNAQH